MIIGILLGISLTIFISSLTLIILGATNIIRENLITGATISPEIIQTNSIAISIISLILIFIFSFILKNKMNRFTKG
tara:strand:+ start:628 stop:858 length:231 start_codon:yes stop_codon:yes gene_type:complete